MPTEKLTAAFVESATVEDGKDRTIYWDEGLSGFGLKVTKDGHKSVAADGLLFSIHGRGLRSAHGVLHCSE
jgi:hypothetical protein